MDDKAKPFLALGVAAVVGAVLVLAASGGREDAGPVRSTLGRGCIAVQLSCQVKDVCLDPLPDGGVPRKYRTVRVLAEQCGDAGEPPAPRWPKRGERDCFVPVGGPESCDVLGATFEDGGAPAVQVDTDRCACRARGQLCRFTGLDGGLQPMNVAQTYLPGQAPFAGAGCVRKVCVELAEKSQDLGQSMPAECL